MKEFWTSKEVFAAAAVIAVTFSAAIGTPTAPNQKSFAIQSPAVVAWADLPDLPY